ncbi:MAG: DUF3769 domain-containing protein [Synechococcales cyanobacterium RU_4_20]|nr:DUF3769 domain-containing protein [Synechococcales cyanobacterium RU_4_20]
MVFPALPPEAFAIELVAPADVTSARQVLADRASAARVSQRPELEVSELEVSELEVSKLEIPETQVSQPGDEGGGLTTRSSSVAETRIPGLEVPELETPELETPELEIPEINLPETRSSQIQVPALEIPQAPIPPTTAPENPQIGATLDQLGVLELISDTQVFDQGRQVITATGEVVMRFQGGILSADRIQINTTSRIVVAEGNAALVRGQQRLRGDRIEYNLTQETGRVLAASGSFNTATSGTELDFNQGATEGGFVRPPSDRVTQIQPIADLANPGAIRITTGFQTNFGLIERENNTTGKPTDSISLPFNVSGFRQEGSVSRWRFEADELRLVPGGWDADKASITNDPFSPPQFKLRAEAIRARALSPLVDEIVATKPRYVFEDKVAIPTFRNRIVLDRRPRDDGLVTFGFDSRDRGGLYLERTFEPISTEKLRLNLTPQFYAQRALFDNGANPLDLDNYGVDIDLRSNLRPSTALTAKVSLSSADPSEFAENTRARINLAQSLGRHTLDLGYSYRTRIYNGSIGFRTVRQSYGAVLQSPNFTLGKTGIVVNYQAGAQRINADTDRADLLEVGRENDRVTLNRYQAGASINRGFSLWQGKPLAATPEAGLRFSPVPVAPGASVSLGLTGLYSAYSNGEAQDSLTSTLALNAQFGHFARNWLDYTALNAVYSQAVRGDASPFCSIASKTPAFVLGLAPADLRPAALWHSDQPGPR